MLIAVVVVEDKEVLNADLLFHSMLEKKKGKRTQSSLPSQTTPFKILPCTEGGKKDVTKKQNREKQE